MNAESLRIDERFLAELSQTVKLTTVLTKVLRKALTTSFRHIFEHSCRDPPQRSMCMSKAPARTPHRKLFDDDPTQIGYCDSETVKFVEYDFSKRSRHSKRSLRSCIGGIVMGELVVHNPRRNLWYCGSERVKLTQYDLRKQSRHPKRNLEYCDRKRIRFALAYEARSKANSSADNKLGGPSLHKDGQYLRGPKWSFRTGRYPTRLE